MDLDRWLRSLGLEKYEAAFRENEINERVLPSLTAEDLKELGYEGSYDRVAAFARQWKAGQSDWVNSGSKRTPEGNYHSYTSV